MKRFTLFKVRLLSSYVFIGIINILLLSWYAYSQGRSIAITKSMQHMTSVRSLVAQKLELKVKYLKQLALQSPLKLEKDPSVVGVCRENGRKKNSISSPACPSELEEKNLLPDTFYHWKEHFFILKSSNSPQPIIWIFAPNILSDVLTQREGLGESGEVYLVGRDYHIKSASRFIDNWQRVKVRNESVETGLKGKQGEFVVKDYRQIEVISSVSPLTVDQLFYVLISEIDLEEILRPVNQIFFNLLKLEFFLILLTLAMAFLATYGVIRKISIMHQEIKLLNLEREKIQAESTMRIIQSQEDERDRIAYNLHDSVGQYLTALKWGLSQLIIEFKENQAFKTKLNEMVKLCESIILEIRSLSQDIMPSLIRDFGCFHAIEEYLATQKRIYDIEIHFHWPKHLEANQFKKDFQVNLYRMTQELVQNAIKHSQATTLTVDFEVIHDQLILNFGDNGRGMNATAPHPRSLSYRAHLFGGEMQRLNKNQGLWFKIAFKMSSVAYEKN